MYKKPHLSVIDLEYPNKPAFPIDSCFKEGNVYFHQRENDVLIVNTTGMCIAIHPIGYLTNRNVYIKKCIF